MVTPPGPDTPSSLAAPPGPDAARQAVAGLSRSFAAGDFPGAESHARLLLGLVPADPNLRRILAAAEVAQGKISSALANLRRALVVGPDYLEARYNLANTLAENHEAELAISQYRRGLRVAPDHVESLINLGGLWRTRGREDRARAGFRRAAVVDPGSALAIGNLGVLAMDGGTPASAARFFAWAHRIAPTSALGVLNLANALRDSGCPIAALAYYHQALAIAPEATVVLAGAAQALMSLDEQAIETWADPAREVLITCLESPEVESNTLNRVSEALLRRDLADWLLGGAGGAPMPEELVGIGETGRSWTFLLSAHLRDSLITDPALEKLLTGLRRQLLEARDSGRDFSLDDARLARAFAHQGVLNEYLWPITGDEEQRLDALMASIEAVVEAGGEVDAVALHLLGAYRPLSSVGQLRRWAASRRGLADPELARDLDILILDRVREEAIAATIADLTPIDDTISTAVRAQYEDNPYPRWNSLARHEAIDPAAQVLAEIAPNAPMLARLPEILRVLIAGCGTGRQAVQAAMTYRGADILAIDLSRPSLAHAKRKSAELGFGAIRFARADILGLSAISERFEIIECSGVLHHMANPEAGLKALLTILAPTGLMKIALYSAAARANVTRLREWIAERGFAATLEDIRAFRAGLPASGHPDAEATCRSIDYNATSAIRDLLFHAQEHQFTVPRIKTLLGDNGLEFLGFLFLDPGVKERYLDRFPGDPACTDLANWAAYEADNPLTFVSMYQFWCRRRGELTG